MGDYVGVITLNEPIPCRKEISGKVYKSKIAEKNILIIFPSIPEDYDPDHIDLQFGDLIMSGNFFRDRINWGMVHAWPTGLFSVNALLCYISANDEDICKIYADFPRWHEKLTKLFLIDTGNYIEPKQKMPSIIKDGGFDDGLQIFEVEERKKLRHIINFREIDPIKIAFQKTDGSYSDDKLTDVFTQVGSFKNIALAYELLITAYRAMERQDFRSAVILGGSAVEQAILKRMEQEYSSKRKFNKAKEMKAHKMLGGRFGWLHEKNISIPVPNYKNTIVILRNGATHKGICPSYSETKKCLEDCSILIKAFNPDVLET